MKYWESSHLYFSDASTKQSKPKLIGTEVLLGNFAFNVAQDCPESSQMPGLAKLQWTFRSKSSATGNQGIVEGITGQLDSEPHVRMAAVFMGNCTL